VIYDQLGLSEGYRGRVWPVLEKVWIKFSNDFLLGYSERINRVIKNTVDKF
jgi:hypothetical protein